MAFWEFLLQKDGDRSWLPLESPTVEILEGRYRVVGRSSRIHTPIEVRIAHDALEDGVPRRTQKRSGCTNQDGLVVIMPFTQLQPGNWELYCIADLMADMMGEGWQYGINLHVLPAVQDAEAWEPDAPELAELPALAVGYSESIDFQPVHSPIALAAIAETLSTPPASQSPEAEVVQPAASVDFVGAEPSTVAESQPVLLERDRSESDSPEGNPPERNSSDPRSPQVILPEALPPLSLSLAQDMHIVQRGEPLILRGEIRSDIPDPDALLLQVRVRLYAPHNARMLFEQVYPLAPAVLPIPVSCAVPLSHHYATYLLLGEAIVEVVSDWTSARVVPLASQSFKVTTDLHELLESFAAQFSEGGTVSDFPDLPDVVPPLEAVSLPSETPGFAQAAELPAVQFQPAQTVLPPQLRSVPPESEEGPKERRTIDLPTFAQESAAQESVAQESAAPTAPGEQDAKLPEPQDQPSEPDQPEPVQSSSPAHVIAESSPAAESSATSPYPRSAASPTAPEIGIAHRGSDEPDRSAASRSANSIGAAAQSDASSVTPFVRLPQVGNPTASQPGSPLIGDTDPELDWQHADLPQPRKPASEKPLAPEDIAFRSLNLQQRFLSRLQSLASDSELSAALQSQGSPVPSSEPPPDEAPLVSVFDRTQPIGEDAHLAHDEFVIDEGWEDIAAAQQQSSGGTAKRSSSSKPWLSQHATQSSGLTLSPDEPLPVPILHLPNDKLVSGSSVSVRVKLPDCSAKLAVKLWLIDRQSRLLLDGPHWLTDFAPDGFGQWMSRIELFLPQGYLEVQMEAISVEIMTQRESEKMVEARSIEPPPSEYSSQYSFDSMDV